MVYDMSQMTEGAPQVFVKRDWLSLQDQNNGNYRGNQMVLDTSQLANSNKYMAYREAYLAVPLLLTATNPSPATGLLANPAVAGTSAGRAFGLKNWFGSIIHSITLDYAGTTIIQQTPLCSMWQQFTLLTTFSLQDVLLNGPSIGFYPDTADAFAYQNDDSPDGPGARNNFNAICQPRLVGVDPIMGLTNVGFQERQKVLMYDPTAIIGAGTAAYTSLQSTTSLTQLYKGSIFNKGAECIQTQVMAIIRLKDIHPFFSQVPLLKGVFMRLTLNLNQPSVTVTVGAGGVNLELTNVTCPLGGVNPLMIAGTTSRITALQSAGVAVDALPGALSAAANAPLLSFAANPGNSMTYNLSVGNTCLDQAQTSVAGVTKGTLAQSIFLYVPAYTFNPTFEEAYLASPTKTIVYTDIYQFQTAKAGVGSTYNFLITNGIANVKSVLVLPFFDKITEGAGAGVSQSTPPYQSPFDPAGCGPTSPLVSQTNFNVVVAGQNMIYNTQKYSYEQYMNQLQGCNSVNANLVNGITSSMISQADFENSYQYYYVNTARMLPVDEAVPKSVQIQGQNLSERSVRFVVFVEYGVQVSVDVLTGSRV